MRHLKPALAALLLLFLVPLTASAATPLVELRVEGPTQTLDSGTWYVTGTERIKRAGQGDDCDPRPGSRRFSGRSALTLLGSGQETNRELRPIRFRNTDVGPQVCQVGDLTSFGHYPNASGGFLYWVDYVSALT